MTQQLLEVPNQVSPKMIDLQFITAEDIQDLEEVFFGFQGTALEEGSIVLGYTLQEGGFLACCCCCCCCASTA